MIDPLCILPWTHIMVGMAGEYRICNAQSRANWQIFDKKVKNAFGVMMDDIVAAIYSAGIVISLVFFSIKFYKFTMCQLFTNLGK